jgi:hypothetical protein
VTEPEDKKKAAERAARELYESALSQIDDGAFKFMSRCRGQSGVILDELIDPKGEAVGHLADVEGDAGALALAMPIDLITFETWLFGQIGDADELDVDIGSHREHWFNFGAWIGATLKARHGGHWLFPSEDPRGWRMGFSKVLMEIAPWTFAEALLRVGQGAAKQLVAEVERLRQLHEQQADKDGGTGIDRFTAQHYVRMHTVPLGQWMVLDLVQMERLWSRAAARDLAKQARINAKKLGPQNQPFVDRLTEALDKLDQDKPAAQQVADRGLYEALAQIICLKRTAAPIAIDIIERFVMPAVHMGVPDKFPPLDSDDLELLRKGVEMFSVFVEVTPFKHQAQDGGFLGVFAHDELSSPYRDGHNLEVGKGDWIVVSTRRLKEMLLDFDAKRMIDKFDEFVKYVNSNPKAPRRRDDGRFLAETAINAIAEFRACVASAAKNDHALLFRLLPPPG